MKMRTLLTITLLFAVSAGLAEPTQKITITGVNATTNPHIFAANI